MLFFKHFLILILIFKKTFTSAHIFQRNVQYCSRFPLESRIISNRKSNPQSLISQNIQAFINNHNFIKYNEKYLRSNRLFSSEKDLEKEVEDLYTGLKDKKWTFTDLQKRLTDEGISLEGCNKTDDVIRRVAQLSLFGKDELQRQLQDNNPEFLSEFNYTLDSFRTEYEKRNKKDKKAYIKSLVKKIEKYNDEVPDSLNDDEVMELAARLQSKNKLEYKLPERSNNYGQQTVEAYKAEADSIFNVYEKVKDDEDLRKNFMDDIKNELVMSNVDFEDCYTDEDLINRLSYSRVFPQFDRENVNKFEVKDTSRRRKFFNQNPLESLFSFQGSPFQDINKLFGENLLGDFEEPFFEHFEIDADMGMNGMDFNGLSIFKDLASMFGINPNQMSQNVQFKSSDNKNKKSKLKFNKGDDDEMEYDNENNHIETDPSLILLQQKAKVSGDSRLQTILNRAIQDPTLRDALKAAATKGYERAREMYTGNNKALYILEKLNDKHIWS